MIGLFPPFLRTAQDLNKFSKYVLSLYFVNQQEL